MHNVSLPTDNTDTTPFTFASLRIAEHSSTSSPLAVEAYTSGTVVAIVVPIVVMVILVVAIVAVTIIIVVTCKARV